MPKTEFTAVPLPGETEAERVAREKRVNIELDYRQRMAGRTRPDLGETKVMTGAPNPLGDPRKPQDRFDVVG